jgi:hypothetical protein
MDNFTSKDHNLQVGRGNIASPATVTHAQGQPSHHFPSTMSAFEGGNEASAEDSDEEGDALVGPDSLFGDGHHPHDLHPGIRLTSEPFSPSESLHVLR